MSEILILSVLQGVAEFLPVSSSGHLAIGQWLLGLEMPEMRLELCLHAGTLVSICIFYRKTLTQLLHGLFAPTADSAERRAAWRYAIALVASAAPAVAVYFLFRERIEAAFADVRAIGAFLMFTGAVLLGTRFLPRRNAPVTLLRALAMGAGQALALLPGVSRSGMTIACARGASVDPEKAAEFSFLMSAPLIAGGLTLEIAKCAAKSGAQEAAQTAAAPGWGALALGAAVSAAVGLLALKLLLKSLRGRWFWLFGPYCIAAGLAILAFA